MLVATHRTLHPHADRRRPQPDAPTGRPLVAAAPRSPAAGRRATAADRRGPRPRQDVHPARGAGDGLVRAVDDVSFDVARGRTLALVGESGSGKSTTARLLLRLDRPDRRADPASTAPTSRRSTGRALRELRRRMQLVYQNPYTSLNPRFTVAAGDRRPAARRSASAPAASVAGRLPSSLDRVALPASALDRKPGRAVRRPAPARRHRPRPRPRSPTWSCSTSRSRRSTSPCRPRSSSCSPSCRRDLGLSYLFISHDLAVVRQIAHDVAVMRDGARRRARPDRATSSSIPPTPTPASCSPPSPAAPHPSPPHPITGDPVPPTRRHPSRPRPSPRRRRHARWPPAAATMTTTRRHRRRRRRRRRPRPPAGDQRRAGRRRRPAPEATRRRRRTGGRRRRRPTPAAR